MNRVLYGFAVLWLAGCAQNSGIISLGDNTYMVSR